MKYLLGLLMCSTLLFAQSQKLIIDAKSFEADDKKGISVFTGDVKIQLDKDKLNADKVDVYFVTSKKTNTKVASKFVATGNVDFVMVSQKMHYIGKGNKIIYSPLKEEYTVIGNGYLEEKNDGRKIYGEKIYINQLSGEARVSGTTNKPVRFIVNVERGEK